MQNMVVPIYIYSVTSTKVKNAFLEKLFCNFYSCLSKILRGIAY